MASIVRPIARSIADAIARYDGGSSIGGGGSPSDPLVALTLDDGTTQITLDDGTTVVTLD